MSAKRIAIFNQGRGRQHGAVLMIMLVIMIIGIAALLVNALNSVSLKNARQQNTAAALAQAKEALIGFAITYGDTHSGKVSGYLPCPDQNGTAGVNGEGSSETCGSQNVSAIGRLPWATLRDGDGECLWYAVSGAYKDNPPTNLMMNWDTPGQFQAYAAGGTQITNANEVVAVIFAPGAPLSGQNRSDGTIPPVAPVCGGNYTASNYLDTGTVNSINFNNADIATGKFIQGTSRGTINDQMVFITQQDIWNTLQKQLTNPQNPLRMLTQRVAQCLANYGTKNRTSSFPYYSDPSNKSLPWPTPLALASLIQSNFNDFSGLKAGRVPYKINNSISASHNSMPNPYLLESTGVNNCPSADWQSRYYPWWLNWKDHLFYAIAQEFLPSLGATSLCGTCLKINGSGNYAAVVIFAGPKLSTQSRNNITDQKNPSNYLEGSNASNLAAPSGNNNYQTGVASNTFNDVLCYIDQSLNVTCP
jgi:type II secretory pathway pseudopilin PulG